MLFIDAESYSFDDIIEYPDPEWIQCVGVYGTSLGFNEIAILPSRYASRLEFRVSSFKDCNLKCPYCSERESMSLGLRTQEDVIIDDALIEQNVLQLKPSSIELVGGEKLQVSFKERLLSILSILDKLDPQKYLRVEMFSNGLDKNTSLSIFKDSRVRLTISIDVESGFGHKYNQQVLETIMDLAQMDSSRISVCLMLSTHSKLVNIDSILQLLRKNKITYLVQPVNESTCFKNNESFDLSFFKNVVLQLPDLQRAYTPERLLFPSLTCYEGNIAINGKMYSSCSFGNRNASTPIYDTVLKECGSIGIAAGISHTCTKLNEKNIPTNMTSIIRLGFSTLAYNISKTPKEYFNNLRATYFNMLNYKHTLRSYLLNTHAYVAFETFQPQKQISYMDVVRVASSIGIKVKRIIDHTNTLLNDKWISGEQDVEVYFTSSLPTSGFVVAITPNNFPSRLMFIGNVDDIKQQIRQIRMPSYTLGRENV